MSEKRSKSKEKRSILCVTQKRREEARGISKKKHPVCVTSHFESKRETKHDRPKRKKKKKDEIGLDWLNYTKMN